MGACTSDNTGCNKKTRHQDNQTNHQHQENQLSKHNNRLNQKQEHEYSEKYIEWNDLDVLRHVIGIWLMGGKTKRNAFEYLKIKLNMNRNNGSNKKWKARLSKYSMYNNINYETNIYGMGDWKLLYPTSINVRPNIDFLCQYFCRYFQIFYTILPKDVTHLISDFVLGKNIRSLHLIDLKLITQRNSITVHKIDGIINDTLNEYDANTDFTAYFHCNIQFRIVDLLGYAEDKVEQKQDIHLNDYNLIKLQEFMDEDDANDQNVLNYFVYNDIDHQN